MRSAEGIQTAFAQEALLQNLPYFKARGCTEENHWNFDFPPRIIDIHLGYKGKPCQNQCDGCYDSRFGFSEQTIGFGQEERIQLKKEVDKIIDWKHDNFKVEEIYLAGGGEPTLFPEIASFLVDDFSKANRDVWLTTNGIHIGEPLMTSLMNAKGILTSVNGSSKDAYAKQMHFDGFDQVMDTLQQVVVAKKQMNPDFRVVVTHYFNPSSIADLHSFIYQLDKFGVDEFRCRYDLFRDPEDGVNAEGRKIVSDIVDHGNTNMKIVLKSPDDGTLPTTDKCFSPFIWPTWNPLHGVFPCAHVSEPKNRINSSYINGIYSLTDIDTTMDVVMSPDCDRHCPSRIHWFNLYLNNHDLNINDVPQYSVLVK